MGVFQGFVLGPLLFTIFANDLSLHAEGALVFQYADETQLLVSGPKDDVSGLTSRMERSLESLSFWFSSHALNVNANKTQFAVLGSRQNLRSLPDITVTFCNVALKPQTEVRNLGVVFHSVLTWEMGITRVRAVPTVYRHARWPISLSPLPS